MTGQLVLFCGGQCCWHKEVDSGGMYEWLGSCSILDSVAGWYPAGVNHGIIGWGGGC